MKIIFSNLLFCCFLLQSKTTYSENDFCELYIQIMEDINDIRGAIEYGWVFDDEWNEVKSYFEYKLQYTFYINPKRIFFSPNSLEFKLKELKEDSLYKVSHYKIYTDEILCEFNDTLRYQLIKEVNENLEYKDTIIVYNKDTIAFSTSKISFTDIFMVNDRYVYIAAVFTAGTDFHGRYARSYLFKKKKNNKWVIENVISRPI